MGKNGNTGGKRSKAGGAARSKGSQIDRFIAGRVSSGRKPRPVADASVSGETANAKKPPSQNPRSWNDNFFQLVLFQSMNGGSSIIPQDDIELRDLAEWARNERILYQKCTKGELTLNEEQQHRMAALKHVGFVFEACTEKGRQSAHNESLWQTQYQKLVQYKRENDNKDPITTTKLGQWVNNQRMAFRDYKFHLGRLAKKYPRHRPLLPEEMPRRSKSNPRKEDGMRNYITQERINKLNALEGGFNWNEEVRKRTPFEQRLEEYKAFREEHGHGFVPQHYKKNRALGKWVNKMRTDYLHRERGEKLSQLAQDRLRLLQEANFEFSSRGGKRNAPKKGTSESKDSIVSELL